MKRQTRLALILSAVLTVGSYAYLCIDRKMLILPSELKSYEITMLIQMSVSGIVFGLIYPFNEKEKI